MPSNNQIDREGLGAWALTTVQLLGSRKSVAVGSVQGQNLGDEGRMRRDEGQLWQSQGTVVLLPCLHPCEVVSLVRETIEIEISVRTKQVTASAAQPLA